MSVVDSLAGGSMAPMDLPRQPSAIDFLAKPIDDGACMQRRAKYVPYKYVP